MGGWKHNTLHVLIVGFSGIEGDDSVIRRRIDLFPGTRVDDAGCVLLGG